MSASNTPAQPAPAPTSRQAHAGDSHLVTSVIGTVSSSGKWEQWCRSEPRLDGFANLEEVLAAWRRRDRRCYQVVAGLTALGSRRGGDDDDAALAVVVLLQDGVTRIATTVSDVCERDDVNTAVWEEVKAAELQLGAHAARYLLQRSRQRLTRPATGMVARVRASSLDQSFDSVGSGSQRHHPRSGARSDRDIPMAAPQVEDPVEDLTDLLIWARETGVIAHEEVDLLIELLVADHDGLPREKAQQIIAERRGVVMRTIRRRRDATVARLRQAAPAYLAAIA